MRAIQPGDECGVAGVLPADLGESLAVAVRDEQVDAMRRTTGGSFELDQRSVAEFDREALLGCRGCSNGLQQKTE